MVIPRVTTTGFLDAFANYLASISALSLTKGTNLFVMDRLDLADTTERVVVYDLGFEQLPQFQHTHLNWDVGIGCARKTQREALDDAHAIHAQLIGKRPTLVSDAAGFERFDVKTIRTAQPGVQVNRKLDSGLYLAEATVQLQVIPA